MKYKIIKNSYFKEVNSKNHFFKTPNNWMVKSLGDISTMSSGGTPSKKKEYYGGDILWITTTDLNFSYVLDTQKKITELGMQNSSAKMIPKNTILFAMYGASIGKMGISSIPSCTNQSICCLIPREDVNYLYLYFLLLNNRKKISSLGVGNGQPNISQNVLNNFQCIIPEIEDQNKIVKILKKQESVISNIEKLISKTGKIFEYFCDREFKLGDIEKNNYQIKDIIIKNPKSTIKAGDIKESTGNIPAFNSSAKLQYFYYDYLVDGENIFLPTGGSASIHYYNGKSCYTTDVFSFRTEKEKVINKYMYYYFKNDLSILDNMFYGAGLKHLNKNELLNYKISIPSLEKQKETVKLLEKQEILIENQRKLLKKEKQKFEWLSEKLLSGEYLVVDEE